MTMSKCIIDMMETRTSYEQLRLKLCKDLRTTRLRQNLLVLIKTKRVVFISWVYILEQLFSSLSVQGDRCSHLQIVAFHFWNNHDNC